jgi:hypothetical protein
MQVYTDVMIDHTVPPAETTAMTTVSAPNVDPHEVTDEVP